MTRHLPLMQVVPMAARSRDAPKVLTTAPRSVRVSLTDRCDLACVYCRPSRNDGYFESRMSMAEWKPMLQGLYSAGIRRVRVTGGEPLLHPEVLPFVKEIADLGFIDVALTTNATQLQRLAKPLKDAGLRRLNISLDTLQPDVFGRLTRGGDLREVLLGIDAALGAGFEEIKLNCVVVRGENDQELVELTQFCWARGMTPRFLEIMAIGEGANVMSAFVSHQSMRSSLTGLLKADEGVRDPDRGPAKYVSANDGSGRRVGFITGTTDTYCKGCDRLRVAANGMLRPCLATEDGVSARAEATANDAQGIADQIMRAWSQKPDGETFKGCTEDSAKLVSIRQIGG